MKKDSVKRVNITLSSKTLNKIDKVAIRGNRSRFIDQAVNFYVHEIGRKNLKSALKEGAIQRSGRDSAISTEWFKIDEETWRENSQ